MLNNYLTYGWSHEYMTFFHVYKYSRCFNCMGLSILVHALWSIDGLKKEYWWSLYPIWQHCYLLISIGVNVTNLIQHWSILISIDYWYSMSWYLECLIFVIWGMILVYCLSLILGLESKDLGYFGKAVCRMLGPFGKIWMCNYLSKITSWADFYDLKRLCYTVKSKL